MSGPYAPPYPNRSNHPNLDGTYTDVGGTTPPYVPIPGLEEAIQQRKAQQEAEKDESGPPAERQPTWEKNLKRAAAVVVGTCGILVTTLPEHTMVYKVCVAVVGIGAALGITSKGNQ